MRQFFQQYEGHIWTSYDTDMALARIFDYYGQLDSVRGNTNHNDALVSAEKAAKDIAAILGLKPPLAAKDNMFLVKK